MKKAILLALLGAMILPAQAAAETAQERAARNGWTITSDEAAVPITTVSKWCPNPKAKRAGSSIKDYANRPLIWGRIGLRVGATNGRIMLCGRGKAHGSPGRGWANVYGPFLEVRRPCCHGRHLRLRYEQEWIFRPPPLDQYWALDPLEIGAHVKQGTNQIWFEARRVWR